MQKLKRVIVGCFLIIMTVLMTGCTGCGDSPEQKAINEQNIAKAKENATNYVKEKYGFEAAVQDAILERSSGLFSTTPTSKVLVKMKYDNKDFNVYIDGSKTNTDGADDYQESVINDAIKELLKNQVSGVERVAVTGGKISWVEYDAIQECCDVLYSVFYDGTNLKEVLSDNSYQVYAAFIDKDLSKVTNADFSELLWDDDDRKDVTLNLISYRDKNGLEQCYEYSVDERYAIYIDEYCELIGTSRKEHKEYKLNISGDVYYYVEDNKDDYIEVNKLLKTVNASDWVGHGAEDGRIVSGAYSIATSKDIGNVNVHIYYPISNIKNYSEKKTEFAYCKYAKEKYNYSSSSVENCIVGEYVYKECSPADKSAGESYYFVFLNDE